MSSDRLKSNLGLLILIAGPVLSMLGAYGGFQYSKGQWEQRLITIEKKQDELEKDMAHDREHEVTREELRGYLDGQSRALEQIQADVRALRYGASH